MALTLIIIDFCFWDNLNMPLKLQGSSWLAAFSNFISSLLQNFKFGLFLTLMKLSRWHYNHPSLLLYVVTVVCKDQNMCVLLSMKYDIINHLFSCFSISGCCYGKPLLVPGGRAFVWPSIQCVQRYDCNFELELYFKFKLLFCCIAQREKKNVTWTITLICLILLGFPWTLWHCKSKVLLCIPVKVYQFLSRA